MKKYFEFSKLISYIMTILVLVVSYEVLDITKTAIQSGYMGSLPYLTTMISAVWGGYSTVLAFIVNKSKVENQIKIANSFEHAYYDDGYTHTPIEGSNNVYSDDI